MKMDLSTLNIHPLNKARILTVAASPILIMGGSR